MFLYLIALEVGIKILAVICRVVLKYFNDTTTDKGNYPETFYLSISYDGFKFTLILTWKQIWFKVYMPSWLFSKGFSLMHLSCGFWFVSPWTPFIMSGHLKVTFHNLLDSSKFHIKMNIECNFLRQISLLPISAIQLSWVRGAQVTNC